MEGTGSNVVITLFALPCLAALAIKLVLAWNTRDVIRRSNVCIWLFIASLFGLNVGEFFLFIFAHRPESPIALLVMKWVYSDAVLMSACYVLVALDIAGALKKQVVGVPVIGIVATIAVIAIVAVILPNTVLLGLTSLSYTLTRIPGPYYWVFSIAFLGGVLVGGGLLLHTYLRSPHPIQKRKAKAMMIGTAPIVMVSVGIAILMQFGFHINYSVIGTFAIIFLLWVLIIVEHKERLYHFLGQVPSTAEHKLNGEINRALARFDLQRVQDLVEQKLIPEALALTDGNLSQAARILGISRNTLTRRMEKFEASPSADLKAHATLKNG